jgi:DNA-binding NarL/FixJ family response regulator
VQLRVGEIEDVGDHIVELTPTQVKVLTVLANEGLTNREIGRRLWMATKTVKTHVETMMRKTHTHTRAELVVWAWSEPRHILLSVEGRRVIVLEEET